MPKLVISSSFIVHGLFIFSLLLLTTNYQPPTTYARTTPEDIVNSKKESYEQRVRNYSSENKLKLEGLSQKIEQVNRKRTEELELITQRQGQILDEYVRRNNIVEDGGKDGINRNLGDKVANARYWITYAHEAIAYQAAKVYIYNLTSERNLKSDILNLISQLQADLNATRSKVIKSQNILEEVIKGQ